ncbi:hypothetical protein [Bradyrhizobium elkanii]|nr:hypothetical protein [Bradyrhizobium elkanii]
MPASAYETLTVLTMDNLKMNIGSAPRVELNRPQIYVVNSLSSGDEGAP